MTTNLLKKPYYQMFESSFQDLLHMGSYSGCKKVADYTRYVTIQVNLNEITSKFKFGLCFPVQCTQETWDKINEPYTNLVKPLCKSFWKLLLHSKRVTDNIECDVTFLSNDEPYWFQDIKL